MRFQVSRSSDYYRADLVRPPCEGAIKDEEPGRSPRWVLDVESLEDLIAVAQRESSDQQVVVSAAGQFGTEYPLLEIYDDHRE